MKPWARGIVLFAGLSLLASASSAQAGSDQPASSGVPTTVQGGAHEVKQGGKEMGAGFRAVGRGIKKVFTGQRSKEEFERGREIGEGAADVGKGVAGMGRGVGRNVKKGFTGDAEATPQSGD